MRRSERKRRESERERGGTRTRKVGARSGKWKDVVANKRDRDSEGDALITKPRGSTGPGSVRPIIVKERISRKRCF